MVKNEKAEKVVKPKKENLMAAYVTIEMSETLKTMAENEDVSISHILRRALKTEIAKYTEQQGALLFSPKALRTPRSEKKDK